MAIHVPKSDKQYVQCPAGTYSAVCVDVVDLGVLPTGFQNEDGSERTAHKIRIVWQVSKKMEDGRPYLVDNRYTLSLSEYQGKKSNLRLLVEAWGVSLMDLVDETNNEDVERLIGRTCLLNIIHAASTKDPKKVYANVASIMPVPEGMATIASRDYVRVVDRDSRPAQPTPVDLSQFPEGDDNDEAPF